MRWRRSLSVMGRRLVDDRRAALGGPGASGRVRTAALGLGILRDRAPRVPGGQRASGKIRRLLEATGSGAPRCGMPGSRGTRGYRGAEVWSAGIHGAGISSAGVPGCKGGRIRHAVIQGAGIIGCRSAGDTYIAVRGRRRRSWRFWRTRSEANEVTPGLRGSCAQ